MLCPEFELPNERGPADMLGAVLRADMVGRFMLPWGGRGTDRDEFEGVMLPDLAPVLDGSGLTLPTGGRGMLWFIAISEGSEWFDPCVDPEDPLRAESPDAEGGRGMNRPAGCGIDRAPA